MTWIFVTSVSAMCCSHFQTVALKVSAFRGFNAPLMHLKTASALLGFEDSKLRSRLTPRVTHGLAQLRVLEKEWDLVLQAITLFVIEGPLKKCIEPKIASSAQSVLIPMKVKIRHDL